MTSKIESDLPVKQYLAKDDDSVHDGSLVSNDSSLKTASVSLNHPRPIKLIDLVYNYHKKHKVHDNRSKGQHKRRENEKLLKSYAQLEEEKLERHIQDLQETRNQMKILHSNFLNDDVMIKQTI